jgi:hypothetical protein
MMRKPNIRSAAVDFGFLAVVFIAGLAGLSWSVALILYAVSALAWWWTRREALAQMPIRTRLTQSAIALLMLAAVMGIFYWIGLALGGRT